MDLSGDRLRKEEKVMLLERAGAQKGSPKPMALGYS